MQSVVVSRKLTQGLLHNTLTNNYKSAPYQVLYLLVFFIEPNLNDYTISC